MKRIIFCADGTWESRRNPDPSNVLLFFRALATAPDQFPLYDDGVGADGTLFDRLAGGAFGLGLFRKIKDGYTQIAHLYEAGDQIFILGFSRGAYTARSLAGMIAVCGLPTAALDPDDSALVDRAFDAYRAREPHHRAALLAGLAQYRLHNPGLAMVGVWDTVGSLGIPAIVGGVDPDEYGFLDTSLHPDVAHAYQALAIDEHRAEFPPTLWSGTPAAHQHVQQVWFVGTHGDVGGGYSRPALGDITLGWMASKAQALGVRFHAAAGLAQLAPAHYALDKSHASWNPLWGFPKHRQIEENSVLASSVALRCRHNRHYRPENLRFGEDHRLAGDYAIVEVTQPAQA